jgi:hypothetical protein
MVTWIDAVAEALPPGPVARNVCVIVSCGAIPRVPLADTVPTPSSISISVASITCHRSITVVSADPTVYCPDEMARS